MGIMLSRVRSSLEPYSAQPTRNALIAGGISLIANIGANSVFGLRPKDASSGLIEALLVAAVAHIVLRGIQRGRTAPR